jgi:hypothetical protein
MNIHIEFTKRIVFHTERMQMAMGSAVVESVALLEKNVKQRAPVGVGGAAGLKGSIFGEVKYLTQRIEGIVGTPLAYAPAVEYGRGIGKRMPPVSALIPWVEKFLTIKEGQTAEGVAWAVARYMAARGSRALRQSPPGERMFERGLAASEPGIQRIMKRHFGDAVRTVME